MNSYIALATNRAKSMAEDARSYYNSQSRRNQIFIKIGVAFGIVFVAVALIFHNKFIDLLVMVSKKWKTLKYGQLLLFGLVFLVAFPPLIGYSALSMLCGMVYGFPYGWPILAAGSVFGSLCSFIAFRYLLHNQAERLVNSNEKFRAFSEIFKEESSLLFLVMVRLCPLPYSLSNGALAAIPELPTTSFFVASVLTSPKLLVHVFVGHKMVELGDKKLPSSTKLLDVLSILVTSSALLLTTFFIYKKMQAKLRSYNVAGVPNNGFDSMIFGNFDDESESGNVELNLNDYDEDNFIITDDDDALIDHV